MHRIIAGGTGFIGRYLVQQWLAQKHDVTVIGRSADTIKQVFGSAVNEVTWDEFPAQAFSLLRSASLVVNLAGTNIGEKRWTPDRKQEIIASRIESTQLLSECCASLADRSPALFNASAIGVYGLDSSFKQTFNEESFINFSQFSDFVSQVARPWEKATEIAKAHGVHVVNLRFGVVLGANGGVLQKLALPFKLGLGGVVGSGKQPFSWIHIADIAAIIEFLLTKSDICGGVNCVAPNWVTQAEFAKTLAKTLHRPCVLPMPAKLLQLLYGQMADELLLSGQIVEPLTLLQNDYQFLYPNLKQALDNIYHPAT